MNNFNFNGDNFDLLKVLIKLLNEFKESQQPNDATTTNPTEDLAKFFIRWKEHLGKMSATERAEEVERVLKQLALDKEEYNRNLKENIGNLKENIGNLKENIGNLKKEIGEDISKDLTHYRELVKRDMRFYLFIGSIVVSILLVIDIKYGAGVLEMLKNITTHLPK
ncbi:MAG: hypothetical protein IJ881_01260 [Neisseriaceae bacterium]|nr:hypothetical protein [Neisseriaceae bacterium]MBR3425895.1 hypothetical protein [Neisseriaceae bacterium]